MEPLHFIIHHQNAIKEYFVVHCLDDIDIFQYSVLYAILLPLKIFTLWAERTRSSLWELILVFEEILNEYKEISQWIPEEYSDILDEVSSRFIARIISSYYSLALAGYALSPIGREKIRTDNIGIRTISSQINYEIFNFSYLCNIQNNYRNNICYIYNSVFNSDDIGCPDEEIDADNVMLSIDDIIYESEIDIYSDSYENEFNKQMSMQMGNRFEQNFLSDIVGISLNQIIHIAEIFSVSEEYVKQCFL